MSSDGARRAALQRKINDACLNGYEFCHWTKYDFRHLSVISYQRRAGTGDKKTINDCFIMADTETSKKQPDGIHENHVVAWSIAVRAYGMNICCLYGHRPDTFVECLQKMQASMQGDKTIIYFHNLSYDWQFLRAFIMAEYGTPEHQLNIRSHQPIYIEFSDGIILKDSLVVAQRSLERWSIDLNINDQKAVGAWDYNKIRNQRHRFTKKELEYIEHDVLAGVECLDALRIALKKHTYSMPWTATGIVREEAYKRGMQNGQRDLFKRLVGTYEQQLRLEAVYHGGFTHANRHFIGEVIYEEIDGITECYDFSSSYPYCMLVEKFPMEQFFPYHPCTIEDIIKISDDYAVICRLILVKPRLKDDFQPMPCLQYSKAKPIVNAVLDNGRVLCCEYCEQFVSEQDILTIEEQYTYEAAYCVEVEVAEKQLLPKWFRDLVFELYEKKCTLKNGDPVLYALAKQMVNALYGMLGQRPVRDVIEENYETGEFSPAGNDPEEMYEKYLKNKKSFLLYQHGAYVTAYAQRHLFELGACIDGDWLYSDTDSCYGNNWNMEKLKAYNERCKQKIRDAGYDAVKVDDREFWPGVAELDGRYSEFITVGAKRYCCRYADDDCNKEKDRGKLKITVAGVPKAGVKCLHDDITNFKEGMIFDGNTTEKRTHTYFYDDIHTDDDGNLCADSIDLSDCDYLLSAVDVPDWQLIFEEDISTQVYDGGFVHGI